MEPCTECGIRHLVVVLEEVHERAGGQVQRRRAARLPLPGVALALEQKAVPDQRNELLRTAAIVVEVPVVAAGQRDASGMVEVVVP